MKSLACTLSVLLVLGAMINVDAILQSLGPKLRQGDEVQQLKVRMFYWVSAVSMTAIVFSPNPILGMRWLNLPTLRKIAVTSKPKGLNFLQHLVFIY